MLTFESCDYLLEHQIEESFDHIFNATHVVPFISLLIEQIKIKQLWLAIISTHYFHSKAYGNDLIIFLASNSAIFARYCFLRSDCSTFHAYMSISTSKLYHSLFLFIVIIFSCSSAPSCYYLIQLSARSVDVNKNLGYSHGKAMDCRLKSMKFSFPLKQCTHASDQQQYQDGFHYKKR